MKLLPEVQKVVDYHVAEFGGRETAWIGVMAEVITKRVAEKCAAIAEQAIGLSTEAAAKDIRAEFALSRTTFPKSSDNG